VPVLLKTQSKYENLTGFFLKTNSIDHQRNSILEFNLAGRKPLEPWPSRRQRNKNNYEAMTAFWTASEMEVGGSGEAILFSERRKKRISIADLKTGKIVHKGDTSDSEKFAVGRKYFAVNNLIKKRLRSRQIADSEELPKEIDSKYSHVAMGRTSDILFAWDNGQLDLLDASTLTRLNSANIKTPSTTAKVSQLLASDDGKKLFINTPGGKIQRLSSQPVRGVTIFELPEEARINYDGSIVVWKNQVFNADGVLLESFDEDAKAIPTDLSGCVGKLQTADKDYQITLINLETGKVFCQTSIRAIEDAGNALDWIDVQISRKRIVYISSNRKVFFIRELETDDSILGLVPTFMTRPPVRIDLGKPFVYRPSIVSAHYPLHLKLEKAPEGARFKNPSTIVWDNPTANPQEFQIRVRDVRGRESVQRFSIRTD